MTLGEPAPDLAKEVRRLQRRSTVAVVLALVALLLGPSAGYAAATLVPGLRGAAGPEGSAGPEGPPGIQGPPGEVDIDAVQDDLLPLGCFRLYTEQITTLDPFGNADRVEVVTC
ncbi:MAG: hypothetical protein ACRCYU_01635 [Nocardioides sp.]